MDANGHELLKNGSLTPDDTDKRGEVSLLTGVLRKALPIRLAFDLSNTLLRRLLL